MTGIQNPRTGAASGTAGGARGRSGPAARLLSGLPGGLGHLAVLAGVLVVWQLLVEVGLLPESIMPTPVQIAAEFGAALHSIATGGYVLGHFVTTIQEVVVAFAASTALGVGVGALISEFRWVRRYAMPYVVAFNAAPGVAFAPIFLVWFGFDMGSKVAMGIASGTFPILIGTVAGMGATGHQLERLMSAYRATRVQAFRKVRMSMALPYIFAGLETGIVLTVTGVVVGEFTGGSDGLGYLIVVAQESLNLSQAFAIILQLCIVSVLFHGLVVLVRRRVLFWQRDRPTRP
ncbi:ABC transporter permease [Nonomuraea antimicrobica]|uniref:ABC transporter permease n=1 Tax=Nonomuraea antimicrobica TaxID=561173 RepID=A0ABP7E5D7_9ACTN